MVCHGTSVSRAPLSQALISRLSKLQIPLKHRQRQLMTLSRYEQNLYSRTPVRK